jgi:error-prone DNA polymerase
MSALFAAWETGGVEAVWEVVRAPVPALDVEALEQAVAGAAESRSTRPVMARTPPAGPGERSSTAGGMSQRGQPGRRRVLVHPSGFKQSPYADVRTPGEDVKKGVPPRKLWHASPGSSGA